MMSGGVAVIRWVCQRMDGNADGNACGWTRGWVYVGVNVNERACRHECQ